MDDKAKYDAACKRLLSEKIILAWIMKSCMEEFRNSDVKEIAAEYIEGQPQVAEVPVNPDEEPSIIRGTDTEDKTLNEGIVTYDIRFHAILPSNGEHVRLIVNIEAQGDFYPGYSVITRGIYYCSRMISSQNGREFIDSNYQDVRKVYSVWICLNPPDYRKNTINRYSMTEELLVGNYREPIQHYDLLTAIMICLGNPENDNYDGVLKLLGTLLSSDISADKKKQILYDEFDIPITRTLDKEVSEMCNLSQTVEAKGIEKGIEKGRIEGILSSIRSLMDSMDWTIEQAMDALKVPEGERSKYMRQI